MSKPLLSVIIPIYNSRPYLHTVIQAFQDQTEKDVELIFVDDGSTDGSEEELRRLTADCGLSVTIHRQKNAGVSAARNAGVALAHGRYLSFVDSDDTVDPDYVRMLGTVCAADATDVLVFRSLRVREGEALEPQICDDTVRPVDKVAMMERFIANPTALSMCNVFVRREFYEERGLAFRTGYPYYEDYELLYRVFAAAERLLITERELYFYIQRSDSAMTRFTVERLSCLSLMEDLVPLMEAQVPDFAPTFEKWMIPRLCWSVMWQAGLAFSMNDACLFAKRADMKRQLRCLHDYPDAKVRLSARLFGLSSRLFVLAARLMGKGHSRVQKTEIGLFLAWFDGAEAPR